MKKENLKKQCIRLMNGMKAVEILDTMDIKNEDFYFFLLQTTISGGINIHSEPPKILYDEEEIRAAVIEKERLERIEPTGIFIGFVDMKDNSYFVIWDRYNIFHIDTKKYLDDTTLVPFIL